MFECYNADGTLPSDPIPEEPECSINDEGTVSCQTEDCFENSDGVIVCLEDQCIEMSEVDEITCPAQVYDGD